MTSLEQAWFAGVFDGEGYVVITNRKTYPCVLIGITNTSLPLLQRIAEVAGCGRITPIKMRQRSSQAWKWCISGSNAKALLQQLLPFLIVKAARAKIVVSGALFEVGFDLSPAKAEVYRTLYSEVSH